ncbi:hypothetical protein JCM10207_008207 [Rhodosporidiobolus poonsookiae]
MALAHPLTRLRTLLLHAPPLAPTPRLAFFASSLSPPSTPPYFSHSRSLNHWGTFTPSYAPQPRSPSSPSPFTHLRTAFHPRPSFPSSSSSSPARQQARTLHTSPLARAIKPYLGRGRSSYDNRGYGRRPPGGGWRERIDRLPEGWILWGLLGINLAVFLVWNYATQLATRFRDASLWRAMQRNFTVSWQNLSQGRIWTLVTSAFSHEGTSHILVNCLSLYFLAPAAMSILGNAGFLSLYLFSSVISSATSALFARFVTQNPYHSAHGASGATFSLASFFALSHPHARFLLFFVVPVPAWLCVGGLFAWDLYSGLGRRGGTVDSMGHVGGAIAGALFFLRRIGRI